MCDTRQHDGFIESEQEEAITQLPLRVSTKDTKEHSEAGEEGWRRIAKLAEVETDPDKPAGVFLDALAGEISPVLARQV